MNSFKNIVVDYIVKPFSKEVLLEKVEKVFK
jgi:FixJ family two-component response regulator